MVTTSDTVNIQKVLRIGTVTNYTIDNVSLFIKHDSLQKRFNATSVVNSTLTSTGLITFSAIPLWGDGSYSLNISAENNNDIDINGVQLDRLGTGYINKITNQSTLIV